ncbi:MAG TPA: hypothetical protein VGJ48_06550 [Pyrinomonadaceae bacterium]|jgi:hypothetical protein
MKERLIQIVDRFVTFLDDAFAFVLVYGGIFALVYVVWLIVGPTTGLADFVERQPISAAMMALLIVMMLLMIQVVNKLDKLSLRLEKVLSDVDDLLKQKP